MTPNILEQTPPQEWALYANLLRDHHWITECGVFLLCHNAYSCIDLAT